MKSRRRGLASSPDKERIARNQMTLAMLPKKEPLKREFRKEQRRLLKVQKRAGLTKLPTADGVFFFAKYPAKTAVPGTNLRGSA